MVEVAAKGPSHSAPAIEFRRVSKTYRGHVALDNVDLTIGSSEMVALIGPSGAGKSTLLRHVSGLVASDPVPSAIRVHGTPIQQNGRVSRHIRRARADIGFIFQQFNLVGRLSLLTNVLVGRLARMPLYRRQTRWFTRDELQEGMKALEVVGLAHVARQRASTLSGGQQQRGAIARAIVQGARVILADEPVASLDPASAKRVMDGLRSMNRSRGVTVLVSVHQVEHVTQSCDRAVALRQAKIVFDGPVGDLDRAKLQEIYGTHATPNSDQET